MLGKVFRKDEGKIALEKLQNLGKKFMSGLSQDSDLAEWDYNLDILKSINDIHRKYFINGMNNIFIKYLLKHHPTDNRLETLFENELDIETERQYLYREMLILTLAEAIVVTNKWEFSKREDYEKFISSIQDYVFFTNDSKEYATITNKCENLTDEELLSIIKEVKKNVMDDTKEQKNWHLGVNNLDTFKFN